jgi:tetratricopeptide (TPR) repeat protein
LLVVAPAATELYIVTAVQNLGVMLSHTGMHEEAETAFTEAMVIRRRMADADPVAYDHYLASAVWRHALALQRADRLPEADAAIREAVERFTRLEADRSEVYGVFLAQTREALADIRAALGHTADDPQ